MQVAGAHLGVEGRDDGCPRRKQMAAHLHARCCGLKWQVQAEVRPEQRSPQGLEVPPVPFLFLNSRPPPTPTMGAWSQGMGRGDEGLQKCLLELN